jgi:hypothetical protein
MGTVESWPGLGVHMTVSVGSCLQLALHTQGHLARISGSYSPLNPKVTEYL